MFSKYGAMFGLDARIALAIFGALSVISGAALYSAIKKANTEKAHQMLVELNKASEAYYLDNGKPVPQDNTVLAYASDLVNNRESLSTWKGPYIDGSVFGTHFIKNSMTNNLDSNISIAIYLQKNSTWSVNTGVQTCASVGDSDCVETIMLGPSGNASAESKLLTLFNDLDEALDNSDGALAGKIRYLNYAAGTDDRLVYMGIPRKRTQ